MYHLHKKALLNKFTKKHVQNKNRCYIFYIHRCLLIPGFLKSYEEGCAERLGDLDAELEGPKDDVRPEEGALLTLGLLHRDEEGSPTR